MHIVVAHPGAACMPKPSRKSINRRFCDRLNFSARTVFHVLQACFTSGEWSGWCCLLCPSSAGRRPSGLLGFGAIRRDGHAPLRGLRPRTIPGHRIGSKSPCASSVAWSRSTVGDQPTARPLRPPADPTGPRTSHTRWCAEHKHPKLPCSPKRDRLGPRGLSGHTFPTESA